MRPARFSPGVVALALLSAVLLGCDRKPARAASSRHRQAERHVATASTLPTQSPDAPQTPANTPQAESLLPVYELKMDPADLRALERNPGSDATHPATFIAEGTVHTNVQVRFRGEWARSWPKKPLKLFFDRAQPFQGHHSVNLNSAWRDPGFVREVLAYHIYAACGVPASRSRLVRLNLNGQFRGLYVEVEQVDKPFLRRFSLKGASLFKATSDNNQADERDFRSEEALAEHYENESGKTNGLGELQRFCHELALAPNARDFFTRRVDLEKYVNYLAATVLVQHWDCFNKNHFLVYDRNGSGKWLAVPWDLDRTLGDHWNRSFGHATLPIHLGTQQAPGTTGWNRLQDRFFSDPVLRQRLYARLAELLDTEFTAAKLSPLLDALETAMGPDAALDRRRWGGASEDVHAGIAGIKSYIERRRSFLQNELKQLRRPGSAGTLPAR